MSEPSPYGSDEPRKIAEILPLLERSLDWPGDDGLPFEASNFPENAPEHEIDCQLRHLSTIAAAKDTTDNEDLAEEDPELLAAALSDLIFRLPDRLEAMRKVHESIISRILYKNRVRPVTEAEMYAIRHSATLLEYALGVTQSQHQR